MMMMYPIYIKPAPHSQPKIVVGVNQVNEVAIRLLAWLVILVNKKDISLAAAELIVRMIYILVALDKMCLHSCDKCHSILNYISPWSERIASA
jgi:hypothetical protein